MGDEAQPLLKAGAQAEDDGLEVRLHGVASEHVLDVVQHVADHVLVLQALSLLPGVTYIS